MMTTKIAIHDRVDAACEATALLHSQLYAKTSHQTKFDVLPLRIATCLRLEKIDFEAIQRAIAALLTADIRGEDDLSAFNQAFVRVRCARIERSLGLPHSDETEAALKAWEGCDGKTDTWEPYVNRFSEAQADQAA
jgi:hypothetical protein